MVILIVEPYTHSLKNKLPNDLKSPITFEVISHRYTTIAKNRILDIFPESNLPMNDEDHKYKYGQLEILNNKKNYL